MTRFASLIAGGVLSLGASPVPTELGPVFESFSFTADPMERVDVPTTQYRNPIVAGYHPDPSIVRVADDYYLIHSSFSHFPGIPVFHSRDLVHWTQIGNAIDRPEQLELRGRTVSEGVFAPDISYHDGLFYIINTCIGCRGNFVITARNPAGPWSQPAWLDFDGIDPSIYWEGDRAYIVNNGPPNETPRYDGHRAIWVQAFDYHAMKMVGRREQIVNGGVDITKKPSWIEGPHLFKRGGYYYLIAAEGGTGDNHSEVVFRSQTLFGPFSPYQNNPILSQRGLAPDRPAPVTSAGHAMFVETAQGDWWSVFLATRPYARDQYNIGRETFLLPVRWQNDWPVILDAGQPIPLSLPKPALPTQPGMGIPTTGTIRYSTRFDKKLEPSWIGIRTPHVPFYRLTAKGLELIPGSRIGDVNGVPAFIGQRQMQHRQTTSTTLQFAPAKDGDRAGLAAVQNDQSYLFFGVTRIAGRTSVALYLRDGTTPEKLVGSAAVAGGRVTLAIDATGGQATFRYRQGGRFNILAAGVDTRFLSTKAAGGFVGTVIGPYAYRP